MQTLPFFTIINIVKTNKSKDFSVDKTDRSSTRSLLVREVDK